MKYYNIYRQYLIILNLSLVFVSLGLYLYNPPSLSIVPLVSCISIFWYVSHLLQKCTTPVPTNWLTADILFSTGYILVFFSYPILYTLELHDYSKLIWWDESTVSRGLSCCLLGGSSFMLAYWVKVKAIYFPPLIKTAQNFNKTRCRLANRIGAIITATGFLIIVLICIYFSRFSSYSQLMQARINVGTISTIYIMGFTLSRWGLIIFFLSLIHNQKYRFKFIIICGIALIEMLLLVNYGDRSKTILIFLQMLIAYSLVYNVVKLRYIIIVGLCLSFIFVAVGASRNQHHGNLVEILLTGHKERPNETPLAVKAIMTMGGSLRTVFGAIDLQQRQGFDYGSKWIPSFFSIIPFCGRFVPDSLKSQHMSVSDFIAPLSLTKGAGTTTIAELYLAGGISYILFFSLLIGYCTGIIEVKAHDTRDFLYIATYCILASTLFSISRFDYTTLLRIFIWPFIWRLIFGKRKQSFII